MACALRSAILPQRQFAVALHQPCTFPRPSRLSRLSVFQASFCSRAQNASEGAITRVTEAKIDPKQELFEYTSSRWLFNEKQRLSERRRVFNVAEFKRLAAQSIHQKAEDVIGFEKFAEGGFNRVFRIIMRDGFEFIGRIPYSIVSPKNLVVASEVATMDYLRLQGLPVPKVFGYSTTSDNPAGTEWIFMERVAGTCLRNLWTDDLPLKDNDTAAKEARHLARLSSRMSQGQQCGEEEQGELGALGPCPIQFTGREIEQNRALLNKRQAMEDARQLVAPYIGHPNFQGEVAVEHYEAAKKAVDALRAESMKTVVEEEGEEGRRVAEENWIHDDFDEDEYL